MAASVLPPTAGAIAAAVRGGTLAARAVAEVFLDRIARRDGEIGAFLAIDPSAVRAAADAVDRRVAAGEDPGALAGVPVAIKDNLAVPGLPCTCASRALERYRPPYAADAVERLLAAGAVVLGKTNLDEFAMGSSTENSALGRTVNPRDPRRVPGGSSGGSAAAVAAGFAPLALGSDTGGSIRQPAAFCGCVGMKPTYGLVSRYGLVAFASSLDQIGPFAMTVADTALLLGVIAGSDPRDMTNRAGAFAPGDLHKPVEGLRIGLPKEYFGEGLAPSVREAVLAAVEKLRAGGATTREISLPHLPFAVPTYYVIATAEASSNLNRYDGVHYGHRAEGAETIPDLYSLSREQGFGAEVKRRILLGTFVLSAGYYDAYYLRALRVRTRIADDFDAAFREVDVIASPVSPGGPFLRGEKAEDPLAMYLSDLYTLSANLAGLPGLSLPCGRDAEGSPVGLQLMAARGADGLLLRAAAAAERAVGGPWEPEIR